MNVRFVIGPTITPVVQNVTKIAAGVHLDFTKRYSRKLAIEAPPTAATASMMEMGIAVTREEGLKSLANEPRSDLTDGSAWDERAFSVLSVRTGYRKERDTRRAVRTPKRLRPFAFQYKESSNAET